MINDVQILELNVLNVLAEGRDNLVFHIPNVQNKKGVLQTCQIRKRFWLDFGAV